MEEEMGWVLFFFFFLREFWHRGEGGDSLLCK